MKQFDREMKNLKYRYIAKYLGTVFLSLLFLFLVFMTFNFEYGNANKEGVKFTELNKQPGMIREVVQGHLMVDKEIQRQFTELRKIKKSPIMEIKAFSKGKTNSVNQLCLDGTCVSTEHTFNIDEIQGMIDDNIVVSSLAEFDANDNQTTYYAGHNPGPLSFMEGNVELGTVITVVDSDGNGYDYEVQDIVVMPWGESAKDFQLSNGINLKDLYNSGSGEESIVVQFCVGENNVMHYATPVK